MNLNSLSKQVEKLVAKGSIRTAITILESYQKNKVAATKRISYKIEELLNKGQSDQNIMKKLRISKATLTTSKGNITRRNSK